MKHLLACAALLVSLALPAFPQSAEFGISAGYGSIGGNDISVSEIPSTGGRASYTIRNGVRVGGRMGFNTRRFFGHEASYAYQHSGLDLESTGPEGMDNADLGQLDPTTSTTTPCCTLRRRAFPSVRS